MGEATRDILREIKSDKKPVSWEQFGSLNLNLPPNQRLPALILISQLGIQIHRSRAKKKPLEISILTSTIKFRANVLGQSKKFKDAKHALVGWAENQLASPDKNTVVHLLTGVDNSDEGDNGLAPRELATGRAGANQNPTTII